MNRVCFNDGWEFTKIDTKNHEKMMREMTVWREVELPHDWTTDYEFDLMHPSKHQGGYVHTGVGWYRKYFVLTKEEVDKTKRILFDGIYQRSTVYMNGTVVGGREYGYSSFSCELSEFIKVGLNCITVRVDCSMEPSTRWFNGAGITRNVWLVQAVSRYIDYEEIYIKTEVKEQKKITFTIEGTLGNVTSGCEGILECRIKNREGMYIEKQEERIQIAEGKTCFKVKGEMHNANRWSCKDPYLYTCILRLRVGESHDEHEEKFGVRTLEFRQGEGFYLNNELTLFKGVCLHHDGGCVGAVVPRGLWKKRINMLKEMGCNAIRTAHNPFNPEFYDLCDEMGVMVVDEVFDGWDTGKIPNDYSCIWEECYEKDLRDWVKRDRNHPSIVLWSIGNEVLNMRTELTKKLMEMVHQLDDTRKVTAGVNDISEASESNRALLEIAGYNDGGGACFLYEEDHKKRPEQLFIASEAPHSLHTRGFYRTQTWWRDKNQPRMEIPNLTEEEIFFDQNIYYNSSYDNSGVRTCVRDSWGFVEKYPYVCGEFRWTGFDYIGEALADAWPTRTNNFGVIDLANFEKDHYYLYQSMWSEKKMVHLLPHWSHPQLQQGAKIPVCVYTNCEEVDLILNGVSLGRRKKGKEKQLEWLVPYEEGTIVAEAYEGGKLIAQKSYTTSTTPHHVDVKVEVIEESDQGRMAQCSFEIKDEQGIMVPYSNNVTGIYLEEGGSILGSDNGAIDDMSLWKSPVRKAFNGMGMYLVRFEEDVQIQGVIGYVVGESYFEEETEIVLGMTAVNSEKIEEKDYQIFYTLDGSVASNNKQLYTKPLMLKDTTCVRMSLYKKGKKILSLKELFIKGEPEKVVDLAHLNYTVQSEIPVGPFSNKIVGEWEYGEIIYCFQEDGKVMRMLGSQETHLGYWWYDFPIDYLETPNYAGTGEIWFVTGERCQVQLENQAGHRLCMNNEKSLITTTYYTDEIVEFNKK